MRIMRVMRPIAHIRTKLFKMNQTAFAKVAGSNQGTVSRWETGELEPDRDILERIREAALDRGLEWSDSLFFEVPPESADAEHAA